MDFALVGMAWFVASRLRMRSTREKLGVGIAMSMGMIAGAASIVKAAIFPTLMNGDISYTSASLHIWSIAEPAITIVAASIPLLRVLFSHVTSLTTRSRAMHGTGGAGGAGTSAGHSLAGSDLRRKKSMSMHTWRAGPYDLPYGNLSAIKGSEEAVMLETLGNHSRVEAGHSAEVKDEEEYEEYEEEGQMEKEEEKYVEPRPTSSDGAKADEVFTKEPGQESRTTSVGYGFGPAGLYETRVAQKYATGYTTPEPGLAF